MEMALFDDFLVLWNKADSEELEQIVNHVLEFVHLEQKVQSEREDEALKAHEEKVSRLVNCVGYVFFPNSKVAHAVRFASPMLTWCGKKISDKCVSRDNYDDSPFCCVCEKVWWVREEDISVAEGLVDIAKRLDDVFGE